ncbi:MAG: hypothetical protein ABIR28_10575 [Vicinamibacteria bacterium]
MDDLRSIKSAKKIALVRRALQIAWATDDLEKLTIEKGVVQKVDRCQKRPGSSARKALSGLMK